MLGLLFLAAEKVAARWTDYLIVINREDRAAASRLLGFEDDQVKYMPGVGIDTRRFHPSQVKGAQVRSLRAAYGLESEAVVFCCVAQFTENKRQADQVLALSKLDRKDVHLFFAGDGPQREKVARLCSQLGLDDRVHFMGVVEDVRPLLVLSRALILSSAREGMPVCLMEAMSMERAVVASSIRGVVDLVDSECGMLFPVGDIDRLASCMTELSGFSKKAVDMGRAGRTRLGPHSIEKICCHHVLLYRGIREQISRSLVDSKTP